MLSTRLMVGMATAAVLMFPPAASGQTAALQATSVVTNYGSRNALIDAAHAAVKNASQRPITDASKARQLFTAAHLYYYGGRIGRAREVMEQAADAGLRRGDIVFTADALLKAAFLAQTMKDGPRVRRLVEQAEALAAAPSLSTQQQAAIFGRIERRGTMVVVRQ